MGILRITNRMLKEHPTGWRHCLLRLEPLVLVGGPEDERTGTASLYDRPLEVFGDPPESGSYSAHGQYLTAFEGELGLTMRWLGTPGAFSHCLAHVSRAAGPARYFEFLSYAERYAAIGLPVYRPLEAQPYYPWSLAWRDGRPSEATTALLRTARGLAAREGWLQRWPEAVAPPWLPREEPVAEEALGTSHS